MPVPVYCCFTVVLRGYGYFWYVDLRLLVVVVVLYGGGRVLKAVVVVVDLVTGTLVDVGSLGFSAVLGSKPVVSWSGVVFSEVVVGLVTLIVVLVCDSGVVLLLAPLFVVLRVVVVVVGETDLSQDDLRGWYV